MEASSPNYSMSGGIQVCACNSRLLKAFHFIDGMFLNPNHFSLSCGLVFRNRKCAFSRLFCFEMFKIKQEHKMQIMFNWIPGMCNNELGSS